jgi:hypothetical protein
MSLTTDELIAAIPNATVINAGKSAGKREIAGAVRYRPSDLLTAERLVLPLDHDRAVILYAAGGPDDQLETIADKMRRNGFADVGIYGGTIREFEDAGGRMQDASYEQVVPPTQAGEVAKLDRRV